MDALELIPFLVNAVPVAYWVTIGHVLTYAMLALCALYVALWGLDKLDEADGKLDHPGVRRAYEIARAVLEYSVAAVEFLPVRVPVLDGLKKLKELSKDPHPDDGEIDKSKVVSK
jgi:hypothetical protein